MNILLLTHSYPDKYNSWRGNFIRDQAVTLSMMHDVTVVYFKNDISRFAPFSGYTFTKNISGNLTEYAVTVPRFFPVINQLKYLLCTYGFISGHILKTKKIDIIHSHLSYPAGFLGTVIQKTEGSPNIITEHTWITKHYRSLIHRLCVLYALKNCRHIIAVSIPLKLEIEHRTKNAVTVIPNVVNTDLFQSVNPVNKSNTFNIGILGSYNTNVKGLDILLESISLIRQRNIILHIGGDGKLLEYYNKTAGDLGVSDKCRFYGEILPERRPEFYSRLDFFILPSRKETFGVVLIEAMACGLPVIATECGGPEEIVTPATGLLVPSENAGELAKAISSMLENIHTYDRTAIRNYVNDTFGQKAFLRRISSVYENLLLTSRSGITPRKQSN